MRSVLKFFGSFNCAPEKSNDEEFFLLNADRDIQSRPLALGPLKEKTKHNKHNKMYL